MAGPSPAGRDTLALTLALGLALRDLGKRAFVSFGADPVGVPWSLASLAGGWCARRRYRTLPT